MVPFFVQFKCKLGQSYVVANALLSFDAPRWGAALNIKNITNERYFVAANAAGAYVGEPLSAFVSANVNF